MSIAARFKSLKRVAVQDLMGNDVSQALRALIECSLDHLESSGQAEPLASHIPGKDYFVFRQREGTRISRPVNAALFDTGLARMHLRRVLDVQVEGLAEDVLQRVLYTVAMAYCCAADLLKTQDRKTPGTFFEILVGHLVARVYGVNPQRQIKVLNLDMETSLPTDFVFDLGPDRSRLHLPVKTSTRERGIQVWAHQRVLDGVYGVNRFRGILVCIAETNRQTKDNSVVEVCLPGQWALYQMFIAQLHRVYYLDVPAKYADLGRAYPFIQVRPLTHFFREAEAIVDAPPAR